jgi:hypothetical protein
MVDRPKDGARAAVLAAAARAEARSGAFAAPQTDFFQEGGVPAAPSCAERDESDRLDGMLPLGISEGAKRGRGRPPLSPNRKTAEVARYLTMRYGDVLEGAVAVGMRPLKELVEDLQQLEKDTGMKIGGTLLEIARFQQSCIQAALPFIHAKRGPEDADGNQVVPIISIGGGMPMPAAPGAAGGRARSIEDAVTIDNPPQQYQQVSSDTAEGSDAKGSDDAS